MGAARGHKNMKRRRRPAIGVVLAAAAAAGVAVPAEAAFPGANGKIAFTSHRDAAPGTIGSGEIYVMNADGSGQTRLTTDVAPEVQPTWSADGSKLAFASARDGNSEIYVMNADGGDQTRLTSDSAADLQPTWSPDGAKLAFLSNRDDVADIYAMNADGSGVTRLTTSPAGERDPAWSPDGSKLAFASSRDDIVIDGLVRSEIYVMNPDGSGQTRLTTDTMDDGRPAWSPDGSKLAFARASGGDSDIYVMNADGSGQTRLTADAADDDDPAWSPDGSKLAFSRRAPGAIPDVYVMNADGSEPTNLSNDRLMARDPDWQPALDTTPPAIALTTPADGADYLLGQPVFADYFCHDEIGGSGLASCAGPVADGAAIDTTSVGSKTFTVEAQDSAGNESSVTHDYGVVYDFGGFYNPVDNAPTLNSMKAGGAVAIKFSLAGNHGPGVLAAGSPRSSRIDCITLTDLDGLETAVGAGSGLVYDPLADRYQFVWKTDKQWTGTCRQFDLELSDATHHRANFKFR